MLGHGTIDCPASQYCKDSGKSIRDSAHGLIRHKWIESEREIIRIDGLDFRRTDNIMRHES